MKKFISFLLAAVLLVSAVPTALATNDYSQGTQVVYEATGSESYTITVPAQLAPGGSGTVTLQGTWADNRIITVTAEPTVTLTNSIKAEDQKVLNVHFDGISEAGSNTSSQKFTEDVAVADIENALFGTWSGKFNYNVDASDYGLEYLQKAYQFDYYSTMKLAVDDVNNGVIGENADADKENAVAGVYIDAGQPYVVLLKDTTEQTTLFLYVDMTINLGGNTLSFNDVGINVRSGKLTIDGRLSGSAIVSSVNNNGTIINVQEGSSAIIHGGSYAIECSAEDANAFVICNLGEVTAVDCNISATSAIGNVYTIYNTKAAAKATISNCDIKAYAADDKSYGVYNIGNATISNCDIKAYAADDKSYGVYNAGTATVSNCDIRAYANYLYSNGNDSYISFSQGVTNVGTLTLNDCYVMGTHTGVQNNGVIYINGGTYEGFGHGGFYFSEIGSTAYVRNATIRECAMPDGYTQTTTSNGSAFYIGGANGQDNIKVYMDNCNMYSGGYQMTLRGSDGEQNNTLYISNSKLYDTNGDDIKIRIDNNTHKLYIGTGCNFTAENAFRSSDGTSMSSAVITTNETYIYNG